MKVNKKYPFRKMSTTVVWFLHIQRSMFDNKSVAKMLKRKEFSRKVQAIVVDEAHLVQQW